VEIKTSDHMVVRSFEVFRENVCSIHTGDIIFAFGRVGSIGGYAGTRYLNVALRIAFMPSSS